jgi:hypothetical protein
MQDAQFELGLIGKNTSKRQEVRSSASVLTRALAQVACIALGCALISACGSDDDRNDGTSGAGGYKAPEGQDASFGNPDSDASQLFDSGPIDEPDAGGSTVITALRIEPEDAVLELDAAEEGEQEYRVFAELEGESGERDVTDRVVFYVPDNWHVGGFEDNGPLFTTNTTAPRGGVLTVQATAANSDGSLEQVNTSLTVRYRGTPSDPRDDGSGDFDVPDDAADLFGGDEDAARAPLLVYPNDGVLLPPNLQRLAVHFEPGVAENTLFEVAFVTGAVELRYYVRCGEQIDNGCVLEIDQDSFRLLADSNREGEEVKLQVRGTDDEGHAVGASVEQTLTFARTDVRGALYYWRTTEPVGIMRADFTAPNIAPEPFLLADDTRLNNQTCVGCHTLSRDGSRIIASQGGQGDGRQVYVADLTMDPMNPAFLTMNGDEDNRIQFASFSPDAESFVSVFGDTDDLTARHTLWFNDGATGARLPDQSIQLSFEPDHPEWSPDGEMIAMTRVGIHHTSQRPRKSGIELLMRDATGPNNGWSDPMTVIPIAAGHNRYNPSFVPDSSLFVFSESICPGGPGQEDRDDCDADADPTAKTWAVLPEADATPVLLARAAAGGVRDNGETNLTDTFPRSAPFESEYDESGVYWVTISSKRRAGLFNQSEHQLLWMFAIDPAKIKDGEDGSYPAFYLPFQDLNTSNHIGQWTSQVVTDEPPPPPPDPPVPPPPPPPPPPVLE